MDKQNHVDPFQLEGSGKATKKGDISTHVSTYVYVYTHTYSNHLLFSPA